MLQQQTGLILMHNSQLPERQRLGHQQPSWTSTYAVGVNRDFRKADLFHKGAIRVLNETDCPALPPCPGSTPYAVQV